MNDEAVTRWRRFVDTLVHFPGAAELLPEGVRDELFELQWTIQLDAFGGVDPIDPSDPRLRVVLDALAALSVAEQDDPSHPVTRQTGHRALLAMRRRTSRSAGSPFRQRRSCTASARTTSWRSSR